MKTRTKLAVVIIALTAIPLLFLNIIISSVLTEIYQESFKEVIKNTVNSQTENISLFFDEILNRTKELSNIESIINYTEYSNFSSEQQSTDRGLELLKSEDECTRQIIDAKVLNTSVETVLLVNNAGKIISSTDAALLGTDFTKITSIIENLKQNKNVSDIQIIKVNGVNLPGYTVSRNIYSSDNQKQGTLIQMVNTVFIQKTLNSTKPYKTSSCSIIDASGNMLEHPYANIPSFKNISAYNEINDYLIDATRIGNESAESRFREFKSSGKDTCAYYTNIPNINWALVSFTRSSEVNDSLNSKLFALRLNTLYILAAIIGLTMLFVYLFSKPIDNIVEIVTKRQRGDQNARFKVNSRDEFGTIGFAFNSMFDDIFESEQRYRTIVEMTDNIVFEINFKKNTVFISNNFNQKFSFRAKSDNLQDSFFYRGRIHKDDKERYTTDFQGIIEGSNYLQGEYRFKNIYGDFAWILIRGTKFFDRDESPTKIIGVIVDIDREKKSEMHLQQRASYDALTQLFNRETFIKSLANEFELSSMRKTLDAVMFIDLDDFKHFNDEYGHACGDEVLKYTADCIKEIVFDKGFAGRFGGDEFVICLNNQKYFGDSGIVAQELIDALAKGFVSEAVDKRFSINCSVGIAFFSENGKNCEEVLAAADEAMYGVKKHGKSNFGYASAHIAPNTIPNEKL